MSVARLAPKAIGFVGLGQMGFPMALNLMRRSRVPRFVVHDYVPAVTTHFVERAKEFKIPEQTLTVAETPKDLATECDVIVTMLPAAQHVSSVYLDENYGILRGIGAFKDVILIDSSTIDVSTTKELSQAAAEVGAVMLDAPVSGGTKGAEAGTLTFMVGVDSPQTFAYAQTQVLTHMGATTFHCGTAGMGQTAKICNNMLLGTTMLAASEALNLGVRLGMDPALLTKIINVSSGQCWVTEKYNPVPGIQENSPASRGYVGGFGNRLMAKDLGLAVAAARDCGAQVSLAEVTGQLYNILAGQDGFDGKDFSSVYKWLADVSGKK